MKTRKKMDSSIDTIDSEFSCIVGITRESPIRVLHVDDDACILRISKLILELAGAFQLETGSSVGEAFDKMEKLEYDFVVKTENFLINWYNLVSQSRFQYL